MRVALFVGIIMLFFPVSYALQEPLAESSVYDQRSQSSFSELLRTILELMDSIRTFISLVPIIISVTLDALSRLAAGELRYTDVAWCFDIIRVLARGLGLSQTYGAFVNAVMALTTGSLTVDDVYEILRVLPPLIREFPGAIARWLSMASNVGLEVVFAPIFGLIAGSVIGVIAGAATLLFFILFFSVIAFLCLSAIAMILSIGIALVLVIVAILIFIGFDVLLFIVAIPFGLLAILFGIVVGAIMGSFAGAIIGGLVGALISLLGIPILVITIDLFLFFIALSPVILSIFAALIFIGAPLALTFGLIVGLPVGVIFGFSLDLAAFLVITPLLMILFTIGYPIMRWASLTGALQPI